MRVCRRFETDFHTGRAVGAKPSTVRKRMRRYGILKWPVRKVPKRGRKGTNPVGLMHGER